MGRCEPHGIKMLPAGGSCLLGSINLAEFATPDQTFDFKDFEKTVATCIVALNEVLEEGLPLHPLQEQRDSVRDWGQVGLGIFGLADLLIKMGIRYGSKEAIALCDNIGDCMASTAIKKSEELGRKLGSYPKFNSRAVNNSKFLQTHLDRDVEYLRNSQLLTIAPTGSISTMLGVSGGIEPIFANYYTRKTESLHGHDEYYKVYTPIVKEYMDEHGLKDDSELPDFFITAQELDYRERIEMQGVWQCHIDASISSTVNLPHEATIEEVEDLYMYAWKRGLKGVTIYRDGCKRSGILTTDSTEADNKPQTDELGRGFIIKADDNCVGLKRTLQTGCGTLHCSAFFDPDTGALLESFLSKGSEGGCNQFMTGLSRMISLSARAGVDIYSIVDQLQSSGVCPSYAVRTATKRDTSKGSCCPVAVGYALLDMYKEMQDIIGFDDGDDDGTVVKAVQQKSHDKAETTEESDEAKCPECGEPLLHEGGCDICKSCGYTHCD